MINKDLPIEFFLENLRKRLNLTQTKFMNAMGYEGKGLAQTYRNMKSKPYLLSERMAILKNNYPQVNLDYLILKEGEPFIDKKKYDGDEEIIAALKKMIERNEQKAVRIEKLEKELRSILEGK